MTQIVLPSVTMTQTSNPERKVPTRRMSFEESLSEIPRHFANDGDLVSSHVAAGLSAVFPDGEDFFVKSVRHSRRRIATSWRPAWRMTSTAGSASAAASGSASRPASASSTRRVTSG